MMNIAAVVDGIKETKGVKWLIQVEVVREFGITKVPLFSHEGEFSESDILRIVANAERTAKKCGWSLEPGYGSTEFRGSNGEYYNLFRVLCRATEQGDEHLCVACVREGM